MTAVQFLIEQIESGKIEIVYSDKIHSIKCLPQFVKEALEMEKQERQKVDKLLNTLLENNMCSHAGDNLIEQFKKDNQ